MIMGRGDHNDDGFLIQWAENQDQPPRVHPNRTVSVGREWMRMNKPRQWAAFCAARLLGREEVELMPEFRDVELVMDVESFVGMNRALAQASKIAVQMLGGGGGGGAGATSGSGGSGGSGGAGIIVNAIASRPIQRGQLVTFPDGTLVP